MKQEETLFVVAEQTGQVVPVDFDISNASVSWEERNVRLQNVVTLLAHKSMLEGFVSFEVPARSSYGERAAVVREVARSQVQQLTLDAKNEFAVAAGHFSLLDSGYKKTEVQAMTRNLFSDFLKKYYGPKHYKTAQAYRRKLSNDVNLIHSQPEEPELQLPSDEGLLSGTVLNNYEKLQAIINDERAGFLPATNREKTQILTLLDYLDKKGGVANQLIEVFKKSQGFILSDGVVRTAGVREGKRAIESIVYELGDYAGNAVKSHSQLTDLQNKLAEIDNPKLTLGVVLGVDHVGFAPLFRYSVIRELYDKQLPDLLPRSEDPMRTVENRWTKEGKGKHKEVTDRYTRENTEPEITEAKLNYERNKDRKSVV